MKLSLVIGWAVVIFVAFYVVTNPAGAGHEVHVWLSGTKAAGNVLALFFNSL
jgi:hypothetical protein